jgi:hypothetical protein
MGYEPFQHLQLITHHLIDYFVITIKSPLEYSIHVECSHLGSKVHSKIVNSLNLLNTFHQNIRGLRNKSDSFEIDGINPYILCLKHHMA